MNKTAKKVIIIVIILLLLTGGAFFWYTFFNKPAQPQTAVPGIEQEETVESPLHSCTDLYSNNSYWSKKFADLYPDLKVHKTGFYCELEDKSRIVSYSYYAVDGLNQGQIVVLFDANDNALKDAKSTICNNDAAGGEPGYPVFTDLAEDTLTVTCSGTDPNQQPVKTYSLNLETLTLD